MGFATRSDKCPICPLYPSYKARRRGIAPPSSMQERRAQVEGQGEFKCAFLGRWIDDPGGVAVVLEARQAAGFGLVGIDRLGVVGAPAGMGDVVDTAAEGAPVPQID